MNTSSPSRKTRARNPSHFGSNNQPSPTGRSSAGLASIGSTGGWNGRRRSTTGGGYAGPLPTRRVPLKPAADTGRDRQSAGAGVLGAGLAGRARLPRPRRLPPRHPRSAPPRRPPRRAAPGPGDDLVEVGQQGHVVRDDQVADVDESRRSRRASRSRSSIDCGQVVRQRPDPDRLDRCGAACRPELGDRRRLTGEDERHVDGQLLGHPDEEQVDVERAALDRMELDAVDEDRLGLLAVDRHVDQGVRPGMAAELLELVGVDRDRLSRRRRGRRRTAGRRPSRRSRATFLPVTSRWQRQASGGRWTSGLGPRLDRTRVRAAARRRGFGWPRRPVAAARVPQVADGPPRRRAAGTRRFGRDAV